MKSSFRSTIVFPLLGAFNLLLGVANWKTVRRLQRYGSHSHNTTKTFNDTSPPSDDFHSSTAFSRRRYPKWKDGSISLPSLLSFFDAMLLSSDIDDDTHNNFYMVYNESIFPETLYVLDSGVTLWTSGIIRRNTTEQYSFRYLPPEGLYAQALQYLQEHTTNTTMEEARWPSLRRALRDNGTIPFLAWYGDHKGCHYHNWQQQQLNGDVKHHSIPFLTTCARVHDCDYAFPIPQYMTITSSRRQSNDWEHTIVEQRTATYPWESQKAQVVWRGGLTGDLEGYTSPRWRIGVRGAHAARRRKSTTTSESIIDMGITYIPHDQVELPATRRAQLEPLAEPIFPMGDFQRYRAILDADGNSWSSRFGLLLCYNSVILKVEPRYEDYFMDTLQPWVHYVPVAYDLSDLKQQAKWALDPNHTAMVLKMIANANQWCQEHLIEDVIAQDMLDIWDAYVQFLDRGDPEWQTVWESRRESYFAAFEMFPLSTND